MWLKRLSISTAALAVAAAGVLVPATSGTAAPADEAAQYKVTLTISAKLATAREDKVALTGVVTPKPPKGSLVTVQVMYENQKTWKKAGTATVKSNGKYRFIVKPESHLDRAYRVIKATDDKATKDTSRERKLDVIGWSWLNQLTPSAAENVFSAGKMPINGDDYSHTLYVDRFDASGFTEFTLGRDCTVLETTFGLSDRTETGGRAAIHFSRDGALAYARIFDLGQSDAMKFDVTDVFRVRFDFGQLTDTPPTEPSAGAARVLCD
jgi:hypothetical protein